MLFRSHLMTVHGTDIETMSYETDRLQFIGRGRTTVDPQAMSGSGARQGTPDAEALSGSEGSVLDPIVVIRCRITLDPEESATIDMVHHLSGGTAQLKTESQPNTPARNLH